MAHPLLRDGTSLFRNDRATTHASTSSSGTLTSRSMVETGAIASSTDITEWPAQLARQRLRQTAHGVGILVGQRHQHDAGEHMPGCRPAHFTQRARVSASASGACGSISNAIAPTA